MKRFIGFLALMMILQGPSLHAQKSSDEYKGFSFGLNFGVYMPSKYTANYYSGKPSNLNNTNFLMTNTYFYNQIHVRLEETRHAFRDDSIFITDWPTNMHYKISMMPGLYGQYNFNKEYSLCFEFNYTKLTTQDALTFYIPRDTINGQNTEIYPIRGQEERVYFDIGIKRDFEVSDKFGYFLIGGLNVNNTKVLKSFFHLEGTDYSIINNYINGVMVGPNAQTFDLKQGGIGFGMYLSGGAILRFSNITLEPGFNFHFVRVDLEDYKSFRPGGGFYVRFMIDSLLAQDN